MSTVQKNCEACAELITVRLADHKRGWGRFCDKACSAAYKCGQRPRDVNEHHAKFSIWAKTAWERLKASGHEKWPTAPSIKDQIGKKVKVMPIYHSPCNCYTCGASVNGPGLCDSCEDHEQGLADMEAGWDGHKNAF